MRGRYKGTYSVQTTPRKAWPPEAAVLPEQKEPASPDWDAVTRGVALHEVPPRRRRTELFNALTSWRRKTRAVHLVKELVRSRWRGDGRRAFTRWCRVAAAKATSLARLTRYKLRERQRGLDTHAVDQAREACAQHARSVYIALCTHVQRGDKFRPCG